MRILCTLVTTLLGIVVLLSGVVVQEDLGGMPTWQQLTFWAIALTGAASLVLTVAAWVRPAWTAATRWRLTPFALPVFLLAGSLDGHWVTTQELTGFSVAVAIAWVQWLCLRTIARHRRKASAEPH